MSIRTKVAVPPQIAVDEIVHAEGAPKVRRVFKTALVGFCHAARENAQLAEAAKSGDDLLCQAIRKRIQSTVSGVILERPDGDLGPPETSGTGKARSSEEIV